MVFTRSSSLIPRINSPPPLESESGETYVPYKRRNTGTNKDYIEKGNIEDIQEKERLYKEREYRKYTGKKKDYIDRTKERIVLRKIETNGRTETRRTEE